MSYNLVSASEDGDVHSLSLNIFGRSSREMIQTSVGTLFGFAPIFIKRITTILANICPSQYNLNTIFSSGFSTSFASYVHPGSRLLGGYFLTLSQVSIFDRSFNLISSGTFILVL